MFHVVLERAGVTADEAVHVGDQPLYDIEGAHRAAMRSIWLNRDGADWPAEVAPATAQITSLADLEQAIAGLPQPAGDEYRSA